MKETDDGAGAEMLMMNALCAESCHLQMSNSDDDSDDQSILMQ